jgi:3-methyladenine DNA glycosylase AlkC
MNLTDELVERISKIENGFRHIYSEAENIVSTYTNEESFEIANHLYSYEAYQARMLATVIFGHLAHKNKDAYDFLKSRISFDTNWRVQEMLATAFDLYCKDIGYENSIPVINEWLNDNNPNICRAVTEGLRFWTKRPYFKDNPKLAIELISKHKNHESTFVRKSVGNALKDISRKHKLLIEDELSTWDLTNTGILLTYKYATKHLNKQTHKSEETK